MVKLLGACFALLSLQSAVAIQLSDDWPPARDHGGHKDVLPSWLHGGQRQAKNPGTEKKTKNKLGTKLDRVGNGFCVTGTNTNLNGAYQFDGDKYCRSDGTMVVRESSGYNGWDFCYANGCVVTATCYNHIGRQGFLGDCSGSPCDGTIFDWGNPADSIAGTCSPTPSPTPSPSPSPTPSPSPSPTASPGTCSCTNPPCGCNCWDCTEERRASGCCTCAENKCGYYDKSGSACAGCSGCWYNGKCGCSANMYGANMYTEFGLSCPDYLSFYATATPSTTTSTTTSSSTPTDHHVPDGPSTGAAGGVAATGDPHLANVRGQRFDLMKPGTHVLVNIPRGRNKHVLLRVQAEARQLGGQCADMYFQELNITGEWVKAKGGGDLLFHAQGVHDEHPKWLKFEKVELKVAHGHTLDGAQYLNFYVRHLGHAGFAVGGLLGEDDHSEAAMPSEACAHRASLLQIKGDQSAPMLSVAEASFV